MLNKFHSITKLLQSNFLTISESKYLFENIVQSYPAMEEHISSKAVIPHSPNFKNRNTKILNNEWINWQKMNYCPLNVWKYKLPKISSSEWT